ncbi:flagellar export protein FliJ [Cellulomonas fimi]|uniref:Flagellar FliJ protein n=1 Tax=Cellulomonas fimi TaxID=1708 RepID=A0A7Y0M0Z5_CELFI|nr:flagellar FliJ family protein [Cellulomonas fimi]NMR21043.1 flagellar export protein FliJ [Cellulomonas fimi]
MERAFRLAGLLRLRKLQEDEAAGRLALANAELRSAEAVRVGTQATLAAHSMPDGDRLAFARGVAGRAALGGLVTEAVTVAGAAADVARVRTGEWSATRSRSVALEKLEDTHRAEVRSEDDRQEQLALDEIASRRAASVGVGAGGSMLADGSRNGAVR